MKFQHSDQKLETKVAMLRVEAQRDADERTRQQREALQLPADAPTLRVNMSDVLAYASKETCAPFKVMAVREEIRRQFTLANERRVNRIVCKQQANRTQRINEMFRDRAHFAGNFVDRQKGDMRQVVDRVGRIALVKVDGWVQYSRAYGTYVNMAGLVIHQPDQKREWAFLRVPPDVDTVAEALESLKPAAVRRAEAKGRRVLRQGDVYLVEQRVDNFKDLPSSHLFVFESRVLYHREHGALEVPFPVRAFQTVVVANGRGGGRYSD